MEAPLSRVEAILQNILGADNVLVPPQSRVEEILLAILNNTEYIHPGDPSRVEEILLAIKDGGSYDKKALSRVEDILIHKLNDEEYTDYSEDDLSRVEKLLIQWIDLHPEVIKELTTSSFPISILANGLPLLDYLISGNSVQSGTPTPDNPIMPEGTGERTGNLFDYTKTDGIIANKYINQRGSMVTDNEYYVSYPIKVNVGETYTWRFNSNEGIGHTAPTVGFYDSSDNLLSTAQHDITIRYFSFKVPANCAYIRASVFTRSNVQKEAMLNTGSSPLPYEPYGYKIPILSGGVTTPVYLGEVQTTRKIKKLVLTGEENIYRSGIYSNTFVYDNSNISTAITRVSSTHFEGSDTVPTGTQRQKKVFVTNLHGYIFNAIAFGDWQFSGDANAFKTWLAEQYANGTPVIVWYVLANEETAVVNEPLMRIGNYADTLSMEQAGVEVPTLKKPNTTVIDVETEVEPSSMYLKYTEPSDGPAPKTPVLGTKDKEIYVTPNNEIYVLRR